MRDLKIFTTTKQLSIITHHHRASLSWEEAFFERNRTTNVVSVVHERDGETAYSLAILKWSPDFSNNSSNDAYQDLC
jgi:hypothetical protein